MLNHAHKALKTNEALLSWLKEKQPNNFETVKELRDCVVFCELLEDLFHNALTKSQINRQARNLSECLHNFKLLQGGLNKCNIDMRINVNQLMLQNDVSYIYDLIQRFQNLYARVEKERQKELAINATSSKMRKISYRPQEENFDTLPKVAESEQYFLFTGAELFPRTMPIDDNGWNQSIEACEEHIAEKPDAETLRYNLDLLNLKTAQYEVEIAQACLELAEECLPSNNNEEEVGEPAESADRRKTLKFKMAQMYNSQADLHMRQAREIHLKEELKAGKLKQLEFEQELIKRGIFLVE